MCERGEDEEDIEIGWIAHKIPFHPHRETAFTSHLKGAAYAVLSHLLSSASVRCLEQHMCCHCEDDIEVDDDQCPHPRHWIIVT